MPQRPTRGSPDLWIYVALFRVYSQVLEFGLVVYEDPDYINIPQVPQGVLR
jgi:hypothetical protein